MFKWRILSCLLVPASGQAGLAELVMHGQHPCTRDCGYGLLLHISLVSGQIVQASLYKIMTHPWRDISAVGHQATLKANENPEQQSYLNQYPWPCPVAGACRWPALHLGHATPSRSQKTHHHGCLLTCNSPCRGQRV